MRVKASPQDLQTLLASDQIPLEAAIRIFHENSRLLMEEIEYGNSLLKDAGTYLSRWTLRRLILAEISDGICRQANREKPCFSRSNPAFYFLRS